ARIAGFLLGHAAVDEALKGHAALLAPTETRSSLPESLAQRLAALGHLPLSTLGQPIVLLTGRGRAVSEAAQILGRGIDLPLLSVDFPALAGTLGVEPAATLAQREAALQPAALLLQD